MACYKTLGYTSIRKVKRLKLEIFLHSMLNLKTYFSSLIFQQG